MAGVKVHTSAVCIIPPEEAWEPIQAIRRRHDRQIDRWMPHVNLLYPFRPAGEFDPCAPGLERACAGRLAFKVTLARFRHFSHGRRSTLWLDPEPAEPLRELQSALQQAFPDCDDLSRFSGGFTPHLSVGQADRNPGRLLEELQKAWTPVVFEVGRIALICRDATGPFRVDRLLPA
jgi:2'-5' RNA ligase